MSDFGSEDIQTYFFEDDGRIPNNPELPVLVYPAAIPDDSDPGQFCRERLAGNRWGGSWVNGVFSYHHYHSTAHEFLGVLRGEASLALGGPEGTELDVERGDALVLPAGVGHCNLVSSPDFSVLGAYPAGQDWDLRRGDPEDRPEVLENIRQVTLPEADPLFGDDGPLINCWH